MNLSALVDSLERGFSEIPPIAIALMLLAGPTVALVGYRLMGVARRMQTAPEVETPLWVCPDCRSVNELRVSHCYRCGLGRDQAEEIEIVVDVPAVRRAPSEVPTGSPFAAVAGGRPPVPGVPVMASREPPAQPVPVGPGRRPEPVAAPLEPPSDDAVEALR